MKALSLDFDFTLRHSDGSLSPILLETMATAKKHNIPVCITSNRTIEESLTFIISFIDDGLKRLFKGVKASKIKSEIIDKINQLSFGNARKKIAELDLPIPIISTLYDQSRDKSHGPYYENIDQALLRIIDLVECMDETEQGLKDLHGNIKKMIAFISGKDDDQSSLESQDRSNKRTSQQSREIKESEAADADADHEPDIEDEMDEELDRLITWEKSLKKLKPRTDKSGQLVKIARGLGSDEVHFTHVDDSREINKGFGRDDMLDFSPLSGEIKHDVADLRVSVAPVPYVEKEMVKKIPNSRRLEVIPAERLHPQVYDAVVSQICPSNAESMPVLCLDLDNTLFNTDKYKARLTPELLTLMYYAQASGIPLFINTNRTIAESFSQMNLHASVSDMNNPVNAKTYAINHSLTKPLSQLSAHGIQVRVVTPMDAMEELKFPYAQTIQEAEAQIIDNIGEAATATQVSELINTKKQEADGHFQRESKIMSSSIKKIGENWKRPQFSTIVTNLETDGHTNKNFELLHIDDSEKLNSNVKLGKKIHNHKITNHFFNVERKQDEKNIGTVYHQVMLDVAGKLGLKSYAETIANNVAINSDNPFKGSLLKDLAAFRYLWQTETDVRKLLALQLFFEMKHGKSLNPSQRQELNYLLGNNPRVSRGITAKISHAGLNPRIFNGTCVYQVAIIMTKIVEYIEQRKREGGISRGSFFCPSKCGRYKISAAEKILTLLEDLFFVRANTGSSLNKEELSACLAKDGRLRRIIEGIPFSKIVQTMTVEKPNHTIAARFEDIRHALQNSSGFQFR